MSVIETAKGAADHDNLECWCCGAVAAAERMVRLGNHPEVAVCTRCARWLQKRAGAIDDQGKRGLGVVARNAFRTARERVVRRGWHQHPLFGRLLRWIGKRTP